MIQFRCQCGQQLQASDEDAGRQSKCPGCGLVSVIPQPTRIVSEVDHARRTRDDGVQAGEPGERPRSRRRDDDDDRPRRRHDRPESTSGKATVAMILGLMSFICLIFTGLPAIIVGSMALRDIKRSRGELGGDGMALTGIITGALSLVLLLPLILIALLLPAVQKVREAAASVQDANNMKQMGIAMHNFAAANGALPQAAAFRSPDGKPLLSWRVAILPYIEQNNLYQQFKLDEPWDSPNNKPLLNRIPKTYLIPGERDDGSGMTHYQVFTGPGTIFDDAAANKRGRAFVRGQPRPGLNFPDITDGTANTILIAPSAKAVPWTKPEDMPFGPGIPLPQLGGTSRDRINILLADGSVRPIPKNIPPNTLQAAITRNGGEIFVFP